MNQPNLDEAPLYSGIKVGIDHIENFAGTKTMKVD